MEKNIMNYKAFSLVLSFCLLNFLSIYGDTSSNKKNLCIKENNNTYQVKQKKQKSNYHFLFFIKEKTKNFMYKLYTLICTYYIKLRYSDPRCKGRGSGSPYYLGQSLARKRNMDRVFSESRERINGEYKEWDDWKKWNEKTKEEWLECYCYHKPFRGRLFYQHKAEVTMGEVVASLLKNEKFFNNIKKYDL